MPDQLDFIRKKKRFRLPCKITLYQGQGRPAKPPWMLNPQYATRNQKRSWQYWSHLWLAMPPWIDQSHVEAFREIYESCPDGYQVDHIVPLRGNIVSGLHIPINLQQLKTDDNYSKSNTWWPGMPNEQQNLFDDEPYKIATRKNIKLQSKNG